MCSWSLYLARGIFEPAFGPDSAENIAQFNENMYPKGVNADFMISDNKTSSDVLCCCTGRFEGEDRDISTARSEVVAMLQAHGLSSGKRVLDVGAGTGNLFLKCALEYLEYALCFVTSNCTVHFFLSQFRIICGSNFKCGG